MFTAAPLRAPASIIGPERILFSVDYTVEREQPGRAFLDALPTKAKVSHLNVERLLKIAAA
jgi:predicted TIM-barrel fold metal-dependent hydrolase